MTTVVADDRLLGIYLNDHLGGSSIATGRCRHARDRNRGTDLGAFLERLLTEIGEDRATLERVMERVRVRHSKAKPLVAAVVERVGRLKPNGQLTGYSPLSRFLELEVLSIGVEGKRLLWLALDGLGDPRLTEFDFDALAQRAQAQREGLERHRLAAARSSIG